MKIYSIYIPELTLDAQFKVLDMDEVANFVSSNSSLEDVDYRKKVLDLCIFNFKQDVLGSLKKMTRNSADVTLAAMYNCCVMLNPGLNIDLWIDLSYKGVNISPIPTSIQPPKQLTKPIQKPLQNGSKISRDKYLNLKRYLSEKIIGQDEAISEVAAALKRSQAGLSDLQRPIGVFMFCGSSGVGKTALAKELHSYLFGEDSDIIRIDCGEFQHKHENQKIIGAPPGYEGHKEGTAFLKAIQKNPNSVILIDEIEKAHPDVANTFLKVFDEGVITDGHGREYSFRNAVIIMTSNLGNQQVVDQLTLRSTGFSRAGKEDGFFTTTVIPKRETVERITNEAVRKAFSPEFLNRVDKIIVFNHLTTADYKLIAELELNKLNEKLSKRGLSIDFDEVVLDRMVDFGVTTIEGARGLAGIRRDKIENLIADHLLSAQKFPRGTIFQLSAVDKNFYVEVHQPTKGVTKSD